MLMRDYQAAMARTISPELMEDQTGLATMACLGLAGETGETIEHFKKAIFHGKPLDGDAAVLEIGDVLWYLTCLCTALKVDLGLVAEANIEKLQKRYPEKFEKFAADLHKSCPECGGAAIKQHEQLALGGVPTSAAYACLMGHSWDAPL